jgi:energy-converting hydrogenase Eha subunit C
VSYFLILLLTTMTFFFLNVTIVTRCLHNVSYFLILLLYTMTFKQINNIGDAIGDMLSLAIIRGPTVMTKKTPKRKIGHVGHVVRSQNVVFDVTIVTRCLHNVSYFLILLLYTMTFKQTQNIGDAIGDMLSRNYGVRP